MTGFTHAQLDQHLAIKTTFEDFFEQAPAFNPHRELITGSVCGVKVQEVENPLMCEIRYLDKLAKGKATEKILRK